MRPIDEQTILVTGATDGLVRALSSEPYLYPGAAGVSKDDEQRAITRGQICATGFRYVGGA